MDSLYCFSIDLLKGLLLEDDLYIQASYAASIGRIAIYKPTIDRFFNEKNIPLSVAGKELFIRSDYSHYHELEQAAMKHGAYIIETSQHRKIIQNWIDFYQQKRFIASISSQEILERCIEPVIREHLVNERTLFIKSKIKGFHQIVKAALLLYPNFQMEKIINNLSEYGINEFIISDMINIESDRWGKIEIRFFVIDGSIHNASRYLHSLPHFINDEFYKQADKIVKELSKYKEFPRNFVLDLALIKPKGNHYIDIVEINPISTAMCYINNSIFVNDEPANNIRIGNEFYYDMTFHPENYDHITKSKKGYSYLADSFSPFG